MRFVLRFLAAVTLAFVLLAPSAHAQQMPGETTPSKYDFRGAWIATVVNLDWPDRNATPQAQQAKLIEMLDALKAAGTNAVMFQIRTEADAFYASEHEPWSRWLTGQQGRAPDPFYDPLAFAIEEAHARGMELHAWFNPYRAERIVGNYPLSPEHPAVEHPEWILQVGSGSQIGLLDPGIPAVRDYVRMIVQDVVERYDIDGVHFDDYFYPYEGIGSEDQQTYETYGQSTFANIETWRLFNVNILIRRVHEDILASSKPWVVFGVSPFGIWRSGTPPGIVGLSAVDAIYADAVNWLDQQWLDYLAPQLYWRFGGGQDYAKLAPWWMSVRNERHIYPGLGAYKADRGTFSGSAPFGDDEIPRQIRYNQANDIPGQIIFRAENITRFSTYGLADSLEQTLWARPTLTPIMPWRDQTPPGAPTGLAATFEGASSIRFSWTPPVQAEGTPEARRYAVYRTQSQVPPSASDIVVDASNLIALTGETTYVDQPVQSATPYHYVVTSVSPNSVEAASAVVRVMGRAVSTEAPAAARVLALAGAAPNPFGGTTSIRYSLSEPAVVSLTVYDVLGRSVAALVQDEARPAGPHAEAFDAGTLPSGTYLVVLRAGSERLARPMLHVR